MHKNHPNMRYSADRVLEDHIHIYVLSDRYNLVTLGNLAYSKATTLLAGWGMPRNSKERRAVMKAVTYAFNNLELSTKAAPRKQERLLSYLAQYVAWALDVFRDNDMLQDLLGSSLDFSKAMVTRCNAASTPP